MNKVSSACATVAIAIGAAALAGWIFDVPALKTVLPGFVAIKANTALAFILAGASLLTQSAPAVSEARTRVARVCAWVVALIGGLTLGQYLFGWQLGIDELLFEEVQPTVWTTAPGRMASSSALAFLLLGLALAALDWAPRRGLRPAEWFAAITFVVTLIAVIEYLFQQAIAYPLFQYSRMALHTIVAFIALSIGVMTARPALGVVGAMRDAMISALERRIYLALALGLVSLLAVGAVSVLSARDSVARSERVEHTHEVRRQIVLLLSALQDIQSGTRGYAITGATEFLEPYERARGEEERLYRGLVDLVRDNPVQAERVRRLDPLLRQRIEHARQVVELRRSGDSNAAIRLIAGGEGKRLMDAVRAAIAELDAEEARLLAARGRQEQASAARLDAILLAGVLFQLLVIGFAIAVIHRDFVHRHRAEAALRASEENLSTTLDSIGDAVLATDVQGCVTRLNPVAERLTGWSDTEARGRPVVDVFRIINEDTRAPAAVPVADVLASGEIRGLANHTVLIARDGSERPVADSAAPIRDGGQVRGVVLVFRDVTEQRRAERQIQRLNETLEKRVRERTELLRQSEEHLRAVIDNVPALIAYVDSQQHYVYVNQQYRECFAPVQPAIQGRPVREVLGEERYAIAAPLIAEALQGRRQSYDWEPFPGVWQLVNYVPRRDAQDRVVGYYVLISDISERKKAEEALRKSEERFRSTLDDMIEGCQLIGYDWRYLYINEVAARQGNSSVAALQGRTMMQAYPGIEATPLFAVMQRCMEDRREEELENRFVLPDGTAGWFQLAIQPAAEGIFILSLDVTERKRAESELLALKDDLEKRVVERTAALETTGIELSRKNRELDQANRLKSEFLANMSHELRTPLNAVIGFSELLYQGLAGELTDRQREFAGDIQASGTHLLALIDDILDLSKIEAGALVLDVEPTELTALLANSLSIVKEKAQSRRIALRFEGEGGLGTVLADSRKIKQIVFNLLSNAVKFTADGGQVTLAARRVAPAVVDAARRTAGRAEPPAFDAADEFVEISVADTGIGIAPASLQKLFEPFVQVDSSLARRHEGTGLGLALTRRLIELHGGGIGVWSTPGQGSRFCVWLPYRAAALPPAVTPASSPAMPLALVIEDSDADAARLQRDLESAGFAVERANDAAQGIERARAQRPAVITLDVFLPDVDGWDCLARLKADPVLSDIPVVIVSVATDLRRGTALGAAHVLHKPLRLGELQHVLQRLGLWPPPVPAPLVLVVDDDPAMREIMTTQLAAAGLEVLAVSGGREAIDAARTRLPRLIVLDLMMPEVSGFDVVAALGSGSTATIPIVIVTAKTITAEERAILTSHVLAVMRKGEFSSEALLAEVRRAMAGSGQTR